MKKLPIVALACILPLLGATAQDGQKKDQGRLTKLMADKLKNSQKLLEGMALADFDKVSRAAEDLIQLSKTAEWFALKTPRYELHSNEFRRSADVIVQKAKAKNIDGVALAYLDMTMSCIRCHQYLREVREASLPRDLPVVAHRVK